jgi:hypothetical protein
VYIFWWPSEVKGTRTGTSHRILMLHVRRLLRKLAAPSKGGGGPYELPGLHHRRVQQESSSLRLWVYIVMAFFVFFMAVDTAPQLFSHPLAENTYENVNHDDGYHKSNAIQRGQRAPENNRQEAIRLAFAHAWKGYSEYAYGHDELRPVTNATNDSWGGFGVTLVDTLDTLYIMGLHKETERARQHVKQLDFDTDRDQSFFETSIRYLGGLLGAYEMSGHDTLYLDKAVELADRLLPAFKHGMPTSKVNLHTGEAANHQWTHAKHILSEVGSIQLEFAYLSHHTEDPKYVKASRAVYTLLDSLETQHEGLYPVYIPPGIEPGSLVPGGRVSFGSLADSFYEYLLKLYIWSAKADLDVLRMYNSGTYVYVGNMCCVWLVCGQL